MGISLIHSCAPLIRWRGIWLPAERSAAKRSAAKRSEGQVATAACKPKVDPFLDGVYSPRSKLELHQLPTWQDQSVAHWPRHPWAKHLEQLGKQERGPPQTRLLTVRICPIKTMLQVASNTQAGRALPQAYDCSSPPHGSQESATSPGAGKQPVPGQPLGVQLLR